MTSNKRPSMNLSLFINNLSESFSPSDHSSKSPNSTKSPKIFEPGLVGLGIVAAMNQTSHTQDLFSSSKTTRVAKLAVASKSNPIPIVFAKPKDPILEKDDENYTCVISHLGNSVKKREYFDVADGLERNSGSSGVFFTSPLKNPQAPAALFDAVDFLSNCYLCRRKLRGLDIFMYRGDKAFCSAECRCQQILSDERKAKCGSGALKSFDCSISPCSAPSIFTAGVAAA